MEKVQAVCEFERLSKHAEEFSDTENHVIETCSVNDAWCQGDVAVVYLGTKKPKDLEVDKPVRQLAPGTTRGSRHMLENLEECTFFKHKQSNPLLGPVILAPNGIEVSHPEHGNITIKESGYYEIRYQRDYAEELRRVQD